MLHGNAGAELFKTLEVKIDGPGANRAPTRKRDPGMAESRHKRTQNQHGGAHLLYELVRRGRIGDLPRLKGQLISLALALERRIRTHLIEQRAHGEDIAHP